MKKLCLLLALALALSTIPVLAASGDMLLGRDQNGSIYFNYAFPMDDALCLVSGSSAIYVYHTGDAELQEHAIAQTQLENFASQELFPFASDGELYAIGLISHYTEENSEFDGAKLYKLVEDAEDGSYAAEEQADLDWDGLTEYYGDDSYPIRPECLLGVGGKVAFRVYDDSGDYMIYTVDIASGDVTRVDDLRGAYSMTIYRDDTLLVQLFSYENPGVTRLVSFDPAAEIVEPLAEVEINDYSPLNALAYDAESDTLYCAQAGEIHPLDLATGEIGEGVTDMPLETYGSGTALVLPGGYYIYCAEGLAVRNLDPGERAEVRLKINDSSWDDSVTSAYYRFSNAHGDVSCVLSRDWNEAQNLLENMMNRDDSVDIYVMSTNSSIYDALYRRGYLMELDGSEKLTALADTMYPGIREELSADGHLVAVPVYFYGWTLGVNETPLEQLGLTLEDVPDNWADLLDFIANLEGPLSEHENVHLFYAGYTAKEARNDLFNALFEDYQRYVNCVNPDAGYDTPLLRGLLEKLDAIDFMALGCAEDVEEDEDGIGVRYDYVDYNEETILFSTSVGTTFGSFYSSYTPLALGLDADTPMPLVLRADVVFVNPFTKHPDMAIAFLEELVDCLSLSARYTLDPALSDPVRGEQNEQNVKDAEQWVADTQQLLDEADEADRQMYEDNLRMAQDNLEYWENYGWEVSQRELDWFRSHDDEIILDRVNWLYADDSGDAWDLINQYLDGAISLDEMLSSIDRKAQMMRLEGN